MTIDELRRQVDSATRWPMFVRVDGREFFVGSRESFFIPPAGNLFCIYQDGAFHILDCDKVSVISREPVPSQ
jgi:hypothetical protein